MRFLGATQGRRRTGTATKAGPSLVAQFEGVMADMISQYRDGVLELSGGHVD
jgi:hypothetical protein